MILSTPLQAAPTLEQGFITPPHSAKPRTWWHWMNGNITREGISADLESLQRVGVQGVMMFNVSAGIKEGFISPPVRYMTPEWRAMVQHAIRESARLGLDFTLHNSDGWATSGGPWVTPALSMQRVTWSESQVVGGRRVSQSLPLPPIGPGMFQEGNLPELLSYYFPSKQEVGQEYYRDISVLALPTPPRATQNWKDAKLSSDFPEFDAAKISDDNPNTWVSFPKGEAKRFVQIEWAQPFTARSLTYSNAPRVASGAGELLASDDGINFRVVCSIPEGNKTLVPRTLSFDAVTARFFRITQPSGSLASLELSEKARISDFAPKAGFEPELNFAAGPSQPLPISQVTQRGQIIDLTAKMKPNGQLDWDAPPGEWTILRIGHCPTGKNNGPSTPSGRGRETDKMNPAATRLHFDEVVAKIADDAGSLTGKSFQSVLIDSWEARSQNWTPAFRQEFIKRRGYDPIRFLPAMTGRVVDSVDISDRFLFDVRQTISDLIIDNYYTTFRDLLHARGLKFTSEAVGYGVPVTVDQFRAKSTTDLPMGEFWLRQAKELGTDAKEAAAASHVYGQKIVAAEAFTSGPDKGNWSENPYSLKALGDLHFAAGINQFVFHSSTHQPWLDRTPGMTFGPHGIHFERTNTWFEQSKAWLDYLSRSQYLLQQGLFVGDVCYYLGEGAPVSLPKADKLSLPLPVGYDYDACSSDALIRRMKVQNGRITLPDGMSYSVLVLPNSDRMTPEVLGKLRELAQGGATIVGPRPTRSPSLKDFGKSDAQIQKWASEMWGKIDGKVVTQNRFGRGKVVWGESLATVLKAQGVAPDFTFKGQRADAEIVSIHRRAQNTDLYFVSNQKQRPETVTCTFRVTGKQPELWFPDTGRIEKVAVWNQKNGLTSVPLRLDPAGSVFVVFRERATSNYAAAVRRDGKNMFPFETSTSPVSAEEPLPEIISDTNGQMALFAWEKGEYEITTNRGARLRASVASVVEPLSLSDAWDVSFPSGKGAPSSIKLDKLIPFAQHPDAGVKYFSGTATYSKNFDLGADQMGAGKKLYLNLGQVSNFAEVSLNGQTFPVLWKPPFRLNVSSAAKSGVNQLEIKVTNLLVNRLIGDLSLPEAERITSTTYQPYKATSKPIDSGLIGPVEVRSVSIVPLR